MIAKLFQLITRATDKYFKRATIIFSRYLFEPIASSLPLFITPNIITWFRAFLIPIIITLLINNLYIYALIFYFIAVSSDGIDGALARLRGPRTKHGALLDPIIDKLLHVAVFTVFLPNAPILILISVVLDIGVALVVGLMLMSRRTYAKIKNMQSNFAGKWKFFFQASALMFLFFTNITNVPFLFLAAQIFLVCAICFSIVAIVIYFRNIIYQTNS